jgi:hypothetical protein
MFFVGAIFNSCSSSGDQSLGEKVYYSYAIKPKSTILILDIDRCNSCSVENELFITSHSGGVESTILVLSKSKKKAEIFMGFSKMDYIWDSLRVGEPYLKDQMSLVYEEN